MRRFAKTWLFAIVTFAIGISLAHRPVTVTSLEEISTNIEEYDGRVVEVETYLQFDELFGWRIGEPFEKAERMTFLEFTEQTILQSDLQGELSQDWSVDQFRRVKVRARGILDDNCDGEIARCCFGQSMSLKNASISVIDPVVTYSRTK